MPLWESPSREIPAPAKKPPESESLDSRGISYAEYIPRKDMEAIPHLSKEGIKEVLKYLERDGVPKDIASAFAKIDAMIDRHMKYDAMNYLLGDMLDTRPESFTATVNPEKTGIGEAQLRVIQRQIPKLQKLVRQLREAYPDDLELPNLKAEMRDLDGIKKVLGWPYGVDIAEFLSRDREYVLAHHATYNISVGKLLREGVGQCHTFAALGKLLLESGKWNLGIWSIGYLASPSGDHTVLEITMRNGEKVVWDGTRGMVGKNK